MRDARGVVRAILRGTRWFGIPDLSFVPRPARERFGMLAEWLRFGRTSRWPALPPGLDARAIFLPIFLNLFAILILCRRYLQRRQCKAYFYLLIIFPSISVPSAISRARFPVVYSTRRFRLLFLSFRFAYEPTLRALGKKSSIDCHVALYSEPKIPEYAFAYCLYHLISERICSGGWKIV